MTDTAVSAGFLAWRNAQPKEEWSKFDLSAARLGFHAGWGAAHADLDGPVKTNRGDRPWGAVRAADAFRDKMKPRANNPGEMVPHWSGWVIVDSFFAGIDYQKAQPSPAQPDRPLGKFIGTVVEPLGPIIPRDQITDRIAALVMDEDISKHVRHVLYEAMAHLMVEPVRKFKLHDPVMKSKGSSWHGRVVGFYSTNLTPVGYNVESDREPGSVQLYPEAALELQPEETECVNSTS